MGAHDTFQQMLQIKRRFLDWPKKFFLCRRCAARAGHGSEPSPTLWLLVRVTGPVTPPRRQAQPRGLAADSPDKHHVLCQGARHVALAREEARRYTDLPSTHQLLDVFELLLASRTHVSMCPEQQAVVQPVLPYNLLLSNLCIISALCFQ